MNKIAITVAQLQALATVSPDGFTVRRDGTVITKEDGVKSYACAIKATKDFRGIDKAQEAIDLANEHQHLFGAIGGWMNDKGELCVEPVMLLPKQLFTLEQAVDIAKAQEQQAIFDLETFEPIETVN